MIVTMKQIVLGACMVLAGCAAEKPKPLPLTKAGQPIIVTTDTQVPGHQLKTIGELRESNKKCGASQIAIGALKEFPHADAVVGYREQGGICRTEIVAGGDYQFCEVICQAKVVKFVDQQPAP